MDINSKIKDIFSKNYDLQLNVDIKDVLQYIKRVKINGGETLFEQGDKSDAFYILLSGKLLAFIENNDNPPIILGEIGKGETVGEIGVIMNELRTATVKALRDSVLLKITKDDFQKIKIIAPEIIERITQVTIKRLLHGNTIKNKILSKVNVVFYNCSAKTNLHEYVSKIVGHISRYKNIFHIGRDENFPTSVTANNHKADLSSLSPNIFSDVISKLDLLYDLIAIECIAGNDEWNNACLRQADEIIVFIENDNKNGLTEFENYMNKNSFNSHSKRRIVILHDKNTEHPTGTKDILKDIKFEMHHHIKKEDARTLERLSRYIMGNTTGLVLSGGGAKGFAHIGIIKALIENNYEFDMIGGTSIGALFGSSVSLDFSIKILYEKARESFPKNITSDYSFPPMISFVKGTRVKHRIEMNFPKIDIEDTWIPFYCVSSNLTRSQICIHNKGDLQTALQASIALPGILPPVVINRELHIDGGVLDNLPIEYMYNSGIINIIASEVNRGNSAPFDFDVLPSNKELFRSKLTKKTKYNLPNLFSVITESVVLGSKQKLQTWKPFVKLMISPDLSKYGLTEWDKFDRLTEEGYNFTINLLNEKGRIKN